MDEKIKNYVEAFFDQFPYSKEGYIAKEKISNKLIEEYSKENDFEKVTIKYNSLEKLGNLVGYSKEDIEKWKNNDEILDIKDIKKSFKREKKYTVFILIFMFWTFISFKNIFARGLFNIISFFIYFGILLFTIKKYKKKRVDIKNCSLNAYSLLKEKYDKHSKKAINGIIIFFLFITYLYSTSLMLWVSNSKNFEILEYLFTYSFIFEVIIFVIIKNLYITKWLKNIIHDSNINGIKKHLKLIVGFSSIYWLIGYCISFWQKNNFYMNIILIFATIYLILVSIYILKFRKSIVYKNIVFNKFKTTSCIIAIILFLGYQFLQKDYWLTQPYINSIPNLQENNNLISYNDETGVYTIKKSEDSDFKLLQLTDIHLGGSPFSYNKDLKALKSVYEIIENTKPDFVVVTGDLSFPLGIMSLSLNNYAPVMQFASFMRNIGIPWAFTYGNHDTENIATYSKEDLNTLFKELSYKTSRNLLYPYIQPNITGRNNQMIEIRNTDNSLNQALFLIDSNAYTGIQINDYDYIHDDQVDWYKENILRLEQEEGKNISSLVFFHIPLQEYATAYEMYENKDENIEYYFGENNEKMINKVCASNYPSKLFDTALELGSTKGFFCGHDHYNNMSLGYKGIRLTYGMSIDYLAMPGIEKDTEQRGGTLITIHNDSTIDINQIPLSKIETTKKVAE